MSVSVDHIKDYHAHVYFDAGTRSVELAKKLREEIKENFDDLVEMGRWHDKPVGPHTTSSYQVKFQPEDFQKIIQWLSLNAKGLSVLIHPQTGDDLMDHTEHALWLGQQLELNTSLFKPQPVKPKKNFGA